MRYNAISTGNSHKYFRQKYTFIYIIYSHILLGENGIALEAMTLL